MAQSYDFDEGLDPTPLSQVGASELLQLIRQALPKDDRGIIIFSDTEPDLTQSPNQARYIWIDTSGGAPYVCKVYNPDDVEWQPFELGANSVGTTQIQNGAVSIIKINPGTPTWFLITSSGGSVTWADINQALADDKVMVSKLLKSTNAGDLLRSKPDGTGVEWFTLNAAEYLADFSVLANKIITSGSSVGQALRVAADNTWEWFTPASSGDPLLANSVELTKLEKAPAELYQIRADSAKDAEWFAPLITSKYQTADVSLAAFPAAAFGTSLITFPHGLAVVPDIFSFRLVVQAPFQGYIVGEELNIDSIFNGSENYPYFSSYADATNIYLLRSVDSATDTRLIKKSDGTIVNPSDADMVTNFKIRGMATKYTQVA